MNEEYLADWLGRRYGKLLIIFIPMGLKYPVWSLAKRNK